MDEELKEAYSPMSVVMTLEDEIDISRGNMLVKANNPPEMLQDIEAMVCWFSSTNLCLDEESLLFVIPLMMYKP